MKGGGYLLWAGWGEMVDVFEVVHFLISDRSKYLTGEVLRVTGGME